VLQIKYRTRTYYTDVQKALMWERWKKGWTLHQMLICSIALMARFEASSSGPVAFDRRNAAAPQSR
jgi:hypothetical protein